MALPGLILEPEPHFPVASQFDSSGRKLFKSAGELDPRTLGIAGDGGEQKTPLQARLAEVILDLKQAERGYLPLENAIRETFGLSADDKSLLSRRQLQKIAEGIDIPLRFDQLHLLDRFLRLRCHLSLADMINPPSVLRMMAEEGRICFLMGSQPYLDVKRIDFSRWDIASMQEIQRGLYATGRPLQILIEDVILRGREAEQLRNEATLPPSEGTWFHLIGNLDSLGESLIVIGSPRVNHGAEIVMATMLGVDAFSPWPAKRLGERPFAFFWPDWYQNPGRRPASCLHFDPLSEGRYVDMNEDDLRFLRNLSAQEGEGEAEEDRRFDCAVIANGRLYPIRRSERGWASYAIIAARRGVHRTCACICGATGPATLAAARVFERFVPDFLLGERDQRVAWCLVRADVVDETIPGRQGFRADERKVVAQSIVDNAIHFYSPECS